MEICHESEICKNVIVGSFDILRLDDMLQNTEMKTEYLCVDEPTRCTTSYK